MNREPSTGSRPGIRRWITKLLNIKSEEMPAVLAGVLMFFFLFTSYFLLRPVRETMGIAGGIENLQWLFTGTFIATLVALPLFGWCASALPRRQLLGWLFASSAITLIAFAVSFQIAPDSTLAASTFYIWLSVFNLLSVSLAWSVLADVLRAPQAKRTFAIIASGASVGGIVGPVLGALLVAPLGHVGLLVVAATLLLLSIAAASWLHRWRDRNPVMGEAEEVSDRSPLKGNPFAGATLTLRSPYLLGISAFVLMLASINTFLYFEQARLVAELFPDKTRQTQVFGIIDAVVQSLSLFIQVFVTGRAAKRLGVSALLVTVPVIMSAGFLALAFAPTFGIFVAVMVIRRVGEYALVRPGREMLYTVVPTAEKYKAKNFIDTVVYRAGDAVSGWIKRAVDLIADNPSVAMFLGALLAAAWGLCGLYLGRRERQMEFASGAQASAERSPLAATNSP